MVQLHTYIKTHKTVKPYALSEFGQHFGLMNPTTFYFSLKLRETLLFLNLFSSLGKVEGLC
jgi:hypothetical protein